MTETHKNEHNATQGRERERVAVQLLRREQKKKYIAPLAGLQSL